MKLKLLLTIIIITLISAGSFVYFKNNKNITKTITFPNDSSNSLSNVDDLTNDNDADNNNSPITNISPNTDDSLMDNNSPAIDDSLMKNGSTKKDTKTPVVSPEKTVSGSMLAHITQEHCNNNCQAFAIDLKLFEYCEEACGISPIKEVKDCDDKKDIQKDYCLKDLAISKKDASACDKIKDANIKQACQNRIAQDAIENVMQ